jgi:hypothetical protein
MQRFFFNTEYFNEAGSFDEDGAVFGSVDAARAEARLGLWDLVSAAMRDHAARVPKRIAIVDGDGVEVGAVNARDMVPLLLRG